MSSGGDMKWVRRRKGGKGDEGGRDFVPEEDTGRVGGVSEELPYRFSQHRKRGSSQVKETKAPFPTR